MVIQSKSGTGKTLVFGVVMLESIDLEVSTVQGVILAPTREIAFQNAHVIYTIGSELPSNILTLYFLKIECLSYLLCRSKSTGVYWRTSSRNRFREMQILSHCSWYPRKSKAAS